MKPKQGVRSKQNYDRWNSRPFKIIPLEEMDEKKTYSLTISPSSRLNNHNTIEGDIIIFSKLFTGVKGVKIVLYPELSKGNLRLHWHGTVKFSSKRSIMMFYYKTLRDLQDHSTYELDTIKDSNEWYKYCTKQLGFFQSAYTDDYIIYKHPQKTVNKIFDFLK